MTEISEHNDKLPRAVEAFVLQWGDMGGRWGVNRSVSQIHALLYLADKPLTADDIAEQLGMARSNVSNSLKELLSWKLIRRAPIRGDRRDHFAAETDVWEIAARIAAGRKEREIDPAIATLKDCVASANSDPAVSRIARDRLAAMLEFTTALDRWYGQMVSLSRGKRAALLKLGSKIASFLPDRS